MSKKRDIELFIYDIIDSCEAIFSYVEKMDIEEFIADRKTYSAVIREFEIIGEAVKHLPTDLKQKYNQVAWRDIVDFRNMLIHEYFGVDFEIVWNTIKEDLPILYKIVKSIEKNNETK